MTKFSKWLEEVGLGKYVSVFSEHEIDEETAYDLTEEDLKELGLPMGPRKKLLKALSGRTRSHAADSSDPPDRPIRPSGPTPNDTSSLDSRPRRDAERRQLTVMFCDLAGSTQLSVQHDPEDFSDILSDYRDCCAGVIERFGGSIARFLGDGLLIYFGYPVAHEHDAEQAVQAALALIDAVSSLEPRPGLQLQTRIGIATGLVVVGDVVGELATEANGAVGETPHLAARLQALARPDGVAISDTTRRLAGGLFEYEDIGAHVLKGFEDTVQVWGVAGRRRVDSRFSADHGGVELTHFVNREEELEILVRRWQRAKTGGGQVVVVSGEPGIGKSRIIEQLQTHIDGERHAKMRLFCSPFHEHTALHPIIDLIERSAGFDQTDTGSDRLGKIDALVLRMLDEPELNTPLIAELLSVPLQDRYDPPALNAELKRARTMELLVAAVIRASRDEPLLLVFEDLHWADPTTRDVLDMLVEAIRQVPVLALFTTRHDATFEWARASHATLISLNRLSDDLTSQLIRNVTARTLLSDEVIEHIRSKTDGIPLFAEELTKAVVETSASEDDSAGTTTDVSAIGAAVPSTLQDSLMARLDQLRDVKEIIQIGAAIGREFSFDLVADLSTRAKDETRDALNQLVKAKLVFKRIRRGETIYVFKHALVQDAAYGSMLRNRVQSLHADIARALLRRWPDALDIWPELLAHHYSLANAAYEAADAWLRAGQRASERSAYVEAIAHLDNGLATARTLPRDEPAFQRLMLALYTALATAHQATKGFAAPETGNAYSAAHEICATVDDASDAFPVLHGVYLFHILRSEVDLARAVADDCLRRAQAHDDDVLLVISHRMLGACLFVAGRLVEAREHIELALTRYRAEDHQSAVLRYGVDQRTVGLAHLACVLFGLGYPEQASRASDESLAQARHLNHAHNLGYALYWRNSLSLNQRRFDELHSLAKELESLGNELGLRTWSALGVYQQGIALARAGEVDSGLDAMRSGYNGYRELGSELFTPALSVPIAEALVSQGKLDEASRLLDGAIADADRTGEGWCLAELHRHRGDLFLHNRGPGEAAQAERHFVLSIDIARRQQAKTWELRSSGALARLWWGSGRHDEAQAVLAGICPWFTEQFSDHELSDARALLNSVSGAP